MSLTENSDQVFLPGGCNRTQNLRFWPLHYYEKKIEITRDDYLSQTYEQPCQNQLFDIDYWIKTSLTYFIKCFCLIS